MLSRCAKEIVVIVTFVDGVKSQKIYIAEPFKVGSIIGIVMSKILF